jgi:Ser-tRNA(Ala) deacylase AlaX
VRLKSDVVHHTGKFKNENGQEKFKPNASVQLSINKEKRILHARLHSAGHLLGNPNCKQSNIPDVALVDIGQTQLEPGKGYHFPDAPYVEYKGDIPADTRAEIVKKAEDKLNELIQKSLDTSSIIAPPEDVVKLCGSFSDYLPKDKPARVVTIALDKGCPCGGTHVKNTKDIGKVKIKKVTVKKGVTRFCYELCE